MSCCATCFLFFESERRYASRQRRCAITRHYYIVYDIIIIIFHCFHCHTIFTSHLRHVISFTYTPRQLLLRFALPYAMVRCRYYATRRLRAMARALLR